MAKEQPEADEETEQPEEPEETPERVYNPPGGAIYVTKNGNWM